MNDSLILSTHTVIVGASAAGLAAAACLKQAGIDYVLLEQAPHIAARWRTHYDRLHLHTSRGFSGLPHFPMPSSYPRYASRDQFVAYLEDYAKQLGLAPRFGQQVHSVEQHNGVWITKTQDAEYHSRAVVVATGYAREPVIPEFPGMETFKGTVIHSAAYKNGASYKGKSVLVVGFGNSGGEIAVDLVEHGAKSALAVRGSVNIIPREILGIPLLTISASSSLLPPAVSDLLFAPIIRLMFGDLRKLGLQKQPYGPKVQIKQDRRIPLIDVGTVKHIRAGNISVYPGLKIFTETGVVFENDRALAVDAVVMATGYRPALHDFLPAAARVSDSSGVPLVSGQETSLPGLYFCGFFVSATGMIREISIEAQQIAHAIAAGHPKPA